MYNQLRKNIVTHFKKSTSGISRQALFHTIGLVCVLFSMVWAYTGFVPTVSKQQKGVVSIEKKSDVLKTPLGNNNKIQSNDEAIVSYFHQAQLQAEVYSFTNKGSYRGMCEPATELYSLSGGILRYIKSVGATGVFCANTDAQYMIEAKLPQKGTLYCIDSKGAALEQKNSRRGTLTCED